MKLLLLKKKNVTFSLTRSQNNFLKEVKPFVSFKPTSRQCFIYIPPEFIRNPDFSAFRGNTNGTLSWNRLAQFQFTHRLQQIHFVLQLPSLVKCSGMHGPVKPIKIFLWLFTPFGNQILEESICSNNEVFLETFTQKIYETFLSIC